MATVLVVDDEVDIVELIRVNLEREGHRVLTALSGEDGLARLRENRPDLLLLDVMLPGVDGWSVLSTIKSEPDPRIADIPVLMITARTGQEDRIRGGIEGAICYLTKPFSPRDVRTAVREALDGDPEPVKRRRVQTASLEQLARMEKGEPAPALDIAAPRPHLTRLEHVHPQQAVPAHVLEARRRLSSLSPNQRRMLSVVRATQSVSDAAARLGVSRSNVYAGLRRVGRKLGTGSVSELLALVRSGDIDPDD